MSYILEALRKSQKDREIGQVPTLATQSLFMDQGSGGNSWGLVAVGLAVLAVAIALYAALRGGAEVMSPAGTSVTASTQTPGPVQIPAPVAAPAPVTSPVSAASPPPSARTPVGTSTPPMIDSAPGTGSALTATPSPPARVKAGAATPPMPATGQAAFPTSAPEVHAGTAPPAPPAARLPANADAELAKAPVDEPDEAPATINDRPPVAANPTDAIPEDLRQDIQSFKEQIKGGEGGRGGKRARNEKPVPPQERRLPREVEERLPSFLLTVHIYDPEPAKRFVVIDGRKMRQGDSSRSGILVEEILPDGVALSFEGHKFFRPR